MTTALNGQQMALRVWVGAYSCLYSAILHGSLLGSGRCKRSVRRTKNENQGW